MLRVETFIGEDGDYMSYATAFATTDCNKWLSANPSVKVISTHTTCSSTSVFTDTNEVLKMFTFAITIVYQNI